MTIEETVTTTTLLKLGEYYDTTGMTEDDLFTPLGDTVWQVSETLVMDRTEATPVKKLASVRVVNNLGIDNRGDAGSQHIWSYQVNYTGEVQEDPLLVDYQEIFNHSG